MLAKIFGALKKKTSSPNQERLGVLSAQTASNYAQTAVNMVAQLDGAQLDYSTESLKEIDRILFRFHANGDKSENMSGTAIVIGCYVGEVMVRNLGAIWVNPNEVSSPLSSSDGNIPLIQTSVGMLSNPIGKVFKAIDNGSEDSIVWFYEVSLSH